MQCTKHLVYLEACLSILPQKKDIHWWFNNDFFFSLRNICYNSIFEIIKFSTKWHVCYCYFKGRIKVWLIAFGGLACINVVSVAQKICVGMCQVLRSLRVLNVDISL